MIIFFNQETLIWIAAISGIIILTIIITSIKKKYLINRDLLHQIIKQKKREEKELYKKLTKMVFGDKDTANRLISMEQGRTPNESKIKLIKMAIQRLERDRQ